MMSRRAALATGLCAPFGATAALPVPAGKRLGFDVIRHGSKIGEHWVGFETAGSSVFVSVTVDIALHLGPIRVFHYAHRSKELWRDGEIASIESRTDDDGSEEVMTALRGEAGLVVEAWKRPRYVAPPRSLPASHWNRAMLDGPSINTQNGRLLTVTVSPCGTGPVASAGGTLPVRCFRLSGDVDLETWYDLSSAWAGLRFSARDGSEVTYRRSWPAGA